MENNMAYNKEKQKLADIKYHSSHPERRHEIFRKFYETTAGRATFLLNGTRTTCKKKHLPSNLTKEWILERLERGVCEVTGLPFDLSKTGTRQNPFAPSLDRKNPHAGYTTDNVQVVVWIYNAKQNFTHDDVLRLSAALLE